MMKKLNFEPFIGSSYYNENLKILVLGESHHFNSEDIISFNENPVNYKNITQKVFEVFFAYKEKRKKFENWMNTFTRFSNVFNNNYLNTEETIKFWNAVSFYNYVQTPVDKNRKSPTINQFSDSHSVFLEILKKLKPNLIIVWGYRLWKNMPKNNLKKENGLDIYEGCPILVIPHPASSKLRYEDNEFIKTYYYKLLNQI